MSALTLYLGTKNLSSWSLRAWLFLKHNKIRFTEQLIELDRPDTRAQILAQSPSGRVPALHHDGLRIWESLAICEYVSERFALPHAWPADIAARTLARSFALEMHSGFAALRRELPFDATRDPEPRDISDAAAADIERICAIWREARAKHGQRGPWLFGEFGIVDAMYAPVALRFDAYAVKLGAVERDYVDLVLAHKAVQQWIEAAAMSLPPGAGRARPAPAVPEAPAAAPAPAAGAAPRAVVPAPGSPTPDARVRSVMLPTD